MSKFLEDLNEQQRAIVTKTEGNILVLAGAGVGKTKTLTYKVAYLIEQGLAESYNILAVTFTNKAAQEMKNRIAQLVDVQDKRSWWIGTFHGICVRILIKYGREIGIPQHFSIADEREQKALLKDIIEKRTDSSNLEADTMLTIISGAKNNLISPSDMLQDSTSKNKAIPEIYSEYQDKLKKMNALDFDDLIMRTIDLLRNCPDIRNKYQEQFKYVMVDESQDLNKAQYELAKILSGKYNNLSLIGDSDQGIYSWRGANINIINAFSKAEGTAIMRLEKNYRCTDTIVQASNSVIEHNKQRIKKTLKTDNAIGDKIVHYTADTQYQEAAFVAGVIDYCCNVKRENEFKDFTILYRTNTQSRVLEDELSKNFIPYQIVGGLSFYDRKEVKDILAYIRLIVNPYDTLSFARIANEPKRGVGPGSLQKIIDYAGTTDKSIVEIIGDIDGKVDRISKKSKEALADLQKILLHYAEKADKMDPDVIIKEIATITGYFDMLDKDEDKDRVLNIYELADIAKKMHDEDDFNLEDFVKQMSLVTDSDTVEDNENMVKLMTAHTAKGLEFPIVFIVGLEENIFPHFLSLRSKTDNELEEERRLFYVSMTRAKERLYISNAEQRSLFGKTVTNNPSRFLKEIPSHLMKKI